MLYISTAAERRGRGRDKESVRRECTYCLIYSHLRADRLYRSSWRLDQGVPRLLEACRSSESTGSLIAKVSDSASTRAESKIKGMSMLEERSGDDSAGW